MGTPIIFNFLSVSRHIAFFSTTHCLNRIELTFLIEIAAFSKCRICLHPHVSQMEHFSNGAILKWSILGSPPYAIFQDPKNREIWHAMCYHPSTSLQSTFCSAAQQAI